MEKNFIALHEDELYSICGGRSEEFAGFIELIGMGFGVIAKLIDKIRSAFRDAQKVPAQ